MHVPVWHGLVRDLRAAGDLAVVGITQEQHPDRCALFAQWKQLDWPILWDPFNLTETLAVPVVTGVDRHGIVRRARLDARRFAGEEFFEREWPAPGEPVPQAEPAVRRALLDEPVGTSAAHALARFLWAEPDTWDAALEVLAARAAEPGARPIDRFRLGVAQRLRYDSPAAEAGDFQRSLDSWSAALRADPNQYIWRRRIQQWGPRLDKPYPFYDWIAAARAEVAARGEDPVALRVPLTGSEVADKTNVLPLREREDVQPDPERKVARDAAGLVRVEVAAAVHTGAGGVRRALPTVRVHLALRPDAGREVHWSNDAGPTAVWISVPQGWRIEQNLLELPVPPQDSSRETRRIDFEVQPADDYDPQTRLRGYALYYVCEGASGECVFRRQDFDVPLELPGRGR